MNADSEDGRVVPRGAPAASGVGPPSPGRSPKGCDSGKWVTESAAGTARGARPRPPHP
jgi:hypothetical protein